ncbi:MAG: DUF1073 domain-containing protein [Clostridia bacterium]|nr:DUF1073 domain-containing protein [Clostridia bacterium]
MPKKKLETFFKPDTKEEKEFLNSLSTLTNSIVNGGWEGTGMMGRGVQASQAQTLFKNNRNYFLSNFRYLLSESYVEHGIIQTLVDLPVDDAFRTELEFKTDELTSEERAKVLEFLEEHDFIEKFKYALKWSRLFGGGALLLMTGDDMSKPIEMKDLKDKPIEFVDVDLWELYYGQTDPKEEEDGYGNPSSYDMFERLLWRPDVYNYYDLKIHKSRVFRMEGRRAPSFVRPRLRGWGFSVLETIVRGFNQYLKGVNATFEMLDEVKVDVYSINNFAMSMMTPAGEAAVRKRIMLANQLKSFLNALVLDKNDSYESKGHSSSFSGLAEVMKEIRYQIASDLRMPLSKIFGIASSGFSSGDDDIKNYNTMIETEIRSKVKNTLKKLYKIAVAICLGKEIHNVGISFGSLDYETPKDLSIRKNSEFQRSFIAYDRGVISLKQLREIFNKQDLLPISVDVNDELVMTQPLKQSIELGKQEDDKASKIGLDDLKTRTFTS